MAFYGVESVLEIGSWATAADGDGDDGDGLFRKENGTEFAGDR